jgi:hypothetical protein
VDQDRPPDRKPVAGNKKERNYPHTPSFDSPMRFVDSTTPADGVSLKHPGEGIRDACADRWECPPSQRHCWDPRPARDANVIPITRMSHTTD